MIRILDLILFESDDKSPYNFRSDNIFAKVIPNEEDLQIIDELSLKTYSYRFSECSNLFFQESLKEDFENKLPYRANTNIFDYTINGQVTFQDDFYSDDSRIELAKLSSKKWQAIFRDSDSNWFILYAELSFQDTPIESNSIIYLNLKSEDSKEELFRIDTFEIVSEDVQLLNVDHEQGLILDSEGNLTFNIYGGA